MLFYRRLSWCKGTKISLMFVVLLIASFPAFSFTGQSFKLKVTYYDFHENGTCPEFEWKIENFAFGYKDMGLIQPTLDVERKPVRGTIWSLGSIYKVDNIEKWFREWHVGDMVFKVGDTVLVPKDSVCYYEPILEDTMCGNYTYDSIKTPSGYYPGDTLYKNVKVNDSLRFVLQTANFNGTSHNFYTLDSNAAGKTNFFPMDGKGFEAIGYPRYFTRADSNHNYSFTMELHYTFTYRGGEVLIVGGDDDIYAFVNNHQVVDLGGLHNTMYDTTSLDTMGLTAGSTYNFDLFFAERHTIGSHFIIKTDIDFKENMVLGTKPEQQKSGGQKMSIDLGKGMVVNVPHETRTINLLITDMSGKTIVHHKNLSINTDLRFKGMNTSISNGVYLVSLECKDAYGRSISQITRSGVSVE